MTTTSTIVIKKSKTNAKSGLPVFYATGRRKEAVAKCWLRPGTGKIIVNKKSVEHYFASPVLRMVINQPFAVTETSGKFDIECTVLGGGLSGQASALKHSISRALDKENSNLHVTLRAAGLLTRDSREVERKMYGHKKSRKSFQFSKR